MNCPVCTAEATREANFCATCGTALGTRANLLPALLEATRLVASRVGDDLDATLDTLIAQAVGLLHADAATLQLATGDGDELEVRRPNPLATVGSPFATAGTCYRPGRFTRQAIAERHPLFTSDYHDDPRHASKHKPDLAAVTSTMVVPLFAADQLVGTLYLDWRETPDIGPQELAVAEALGQHAAIAIRTARLVDQSGRARAELEAILDAADDGIAVYAVDGPLLRVNRRGRQDYETILGKIPANIEELHELVRPRHEDGTPIETPPSLRARREGIGGSTVELVRGVDGQDHRVLVHASPVRAADGAIRAVVILWRDICDLYDGIAEHARLEGAVKTARRATHELNNQLALAVGYGELLTAMLPPETGDMGLLAEKMHLGAVEAARTVDRLGRIIRFEELEFGGQVMLDLDRATAPTSR